MFDYWVESMVAAFVVVVSLAVCIAMTIALSYGECVQVSSKMRVPFQYVIPAGCMIEAKPGEWVQLSAFRVEK